MKQTTIKDSEGVYEGEVNEKNEKHGQGKMTWKSGDVYEGEWKDDEEHGKGKYTWTSGKVYEGEWKDGEEDGQGKMSDDEFGDKYEGEWKDGRKHGQGKLIDGNGNVYEGKWKNGYRQGWMSVCKDGFIFRGFFDEDRFNQDRLLKFDDIFYPNGCHFVSVYFCDEDIEGDGVEGSYLEPITGYGRMTYPNDDIYTGELKDGEFNGKGKYIWKNGDVYEGYWKNGKKHGWGKMTYLSGTVHEGKWKDGEKHGWFKIATNGKAFSCQFEKDKNLSDFSIKFKKRKIEDLK